MELTEKLIIAALMQWEMEYGNKQVVLPNATAVYRWEADLLAITKAYYVHEYEVKLSLADFKADFRKKVKHKILDGGYSWFKPNYFWYAVGFDLDVALLPPYAGLLTITINGDKISINTVKVAPRLHTKKLHDKARNSLARWLSYKLKNEYYSAYKFRLR